MERWSSQGAMLGTALDQPNFILYYTLGYYGNEISEALLFNKDTSTTPRLPVFKACVIIYDLNFYDNNVVSENR